MTIINLTVYKNVAKRRLGMLGNFYSGTFNRFATVFPREFQMSHEMTPLVAHKTSKNPLGKSGEAYPTAFSMQR
jgi:hypothetical protein